MDAYVGEIKLWPSTRLPENWVLCNGQTLNINDYQALYSLIGTIYGGDGRTTFAVPNLQQSVVVGVGQMPNNGQNYTIGKSGGATQVTLTQANLPAHTHAVTVSTDAGTTNNPTNGIMGGPNSTGTSAPLVMYADVTKGAVTMNSLDPATLSTSPGGSMAHNNMSPYLVLNYIIAVNGIYPNFNN